MTLRIWHLRFRGWTGAASAERRYDWYSDHVVMAADEASARALARCGDECDRHVPPGATALPGLVCVWADPARTTCTALGTADLWQSAGRVASTFHAG